MLGREALLRQLILLLVIGLTITSDKADGASRVYRITESN